jgi:peptide deformylase
MQEMQEQIPLWKQIEQNDLMEKMLKEYETERPKILIQPSLELRHRCTTIGDAENTLIKLETALLDPLSGEYLGVGLSANQIGLLDRVAIIRYGDYHLDLVNPRVVAHSATRRGSTEECLSIPNFKATIMRWEQITVATDNYHQNLIINNFDVSRTIQHEISHLDGQLLCDYEKTGRNDPCPCGSKLKYKKCCGK